MLNRTTLLIVSLLLINGCVSQTTQNRSSTMKPEDSRDAVAQVAPAMAAYSEQFIEKDLWNRPEL